jgi:hypothetical protein
VRLGAPFRSLNWRLAGADISGVRNFAVGRGIAMEHVVFYPSVDGTPAFRRVSSLEDAVKFVEHLRNSEGTTEFSVHALAEVPLTLRAYYHVELPTQAVAEPAESAAPEPAPFTDGPTVAVPDSAAVVEVFQVDGAPVSAAVSHAEAEAPLPEVPLGDSQEVVPIAGGRRSMGFFARS